MEGPIRESAVEREQLAVGFGRDHGLLVGSGFSQRNVAGRPAGRDFACVNFEREIAVDDMVRPDGRAKRDILRVASADTSDHPVSFGEIEARIETDGHHGGGSFRGADAGEHFENTILVEAQVMIAGGQRQNLIEMFAVDPELEFAGRVAGIFAALEHGDDDNFYLDGLWRGR